jgi:hypothetical protein
MYDTSRLYFKAVRLRSQNGESNGIGIIQYSAGTTLSIASLYYDKPLTNREAFAEIKAYVEAECNGQSAKVRISNVRNFKVDGGEVRYVALRGGSHMWEPTELARDAIYRGTSITERLGESPCFGANEGTSRQAK